jgi:hypothetical protein
LQVESQKTFNLQLEKKAMQNTSRKAKHHPLSGKALNRKRNSFNAENEKSPRSRISIEAWLVIANITITAIVGIYLAFRNENLQQQIIKWQSQAGLAEIHITQDTPSAQFSNGMIRIRNSGLSAAKNLRIVICLQDADMSISDISDFEIVPNNPSIIFKRENIKQSCGMYGYSGIDNATLLTVESLPPNQSFDFIVQIDRLMPSSYSTYKTRVYLAVPKVSFRDGSNYPFETSISDAFQKYMATELAAAYLELSTSCENCVVKYDNFKFVVSVMENNSWRNFQVSNDDSMLASGYIEVSFDVDTTYQFLKNSVFVPAQELYLLASYSADGSANITEADKNKFRIFNP